MTPVRHAMLSFLAMKHTPVTLQTIVETEGVRGQCNATTVYRTLMLFKAADIVRLVATPHKTSYFMLDVPDESSHFLICRRCGTITEFPLPNAIVETIRHAAAAQGFTSARQDYEIHGVCAACQIKHRTQILPSKLIL